MGNTLEAALAAMMNAGDDPAPEILDRVRAFGTAAIPSLIEIATDRTLNDLESDDPRVYANLHAIKILGELRATEAIEPVLPYIAWDDDEWLDDYLPEFFGHIGEPAIAPLERVLADDTRTIYTYARVSHALVKIVQEHPTMRERVVKLLTQYLEPEHTDSQDHETRAGFFIVDLCDLRATEALPAIRRAFEEDRVDTQITDLDFTEREMQGLPLEMPDLEKVLEQREHEGMKLSLRCTQCGRERRYDVGTLFIDLGTMERRKRGEKTKYDEFVITRRIVCPKCGAVDKYELTGMAHTALVADLLVRQVSGKHADEDTGPVRYMRFVLTDGREMHPREGLDLMRGEVVRAPRRADLRVRLGNLLRFLGYLDEAISEFNTALDLDPNEIEACLNLGRIYGVQGDLIASRKMFQRALELLPTTVRYSSSLKIEAAADIENCLERVERGEELEPSVLTDLAPTKPSTASTSQVQSGLRARTSTTPARSTVPAKVGRNDPCPCGSGKKYKHCHGR